MGKKVAIIGAGPAGLTAAYILGKARYQVTVFEKDPQNVGGISRTESYKGYHFDVGGHRFFSKSSEVEAMWTEILGEDLLVRPRRSRIYYNKSFYTYPLVAGEALKSLGFRNSLLCMASYLKAKAFPIADPRNFEDWVINQFGRRLYTIFFKTYTEKVWGVPCRELSADWAAQRIKGLSLGQAVRHALFGSADKGSQGKVIKSLIDTFRYPKLGPGMMWEACKTRCQAWGVKVEMGAAVEGVYLADGKWTVRSRDGRGAVDFDHVISSAPLRELIPTISPAFPQAALQAAAQLKYRDFLTVVLICHDKDAFTDNWVYIHDPDVRVGRIQNFKSWSPFMVPDADMACYGLEYFCNEDDGMFDRSNEELIAMATEEIDRIGLVDPRYVVDGYVVRQHKAYPVYDHDYRAQVDLIRAALTSYPNLHLVGRNGMHRYNNQDHSMMTAMLAARNIIAGRQRYDLWAVNIDAEYLEETASSDIEIQD